MSISERFSILHGKNILVTGHTGFKGSWLCLWLCALGANVIGYSLENNHPEGNFSLCGLKERMTHIVADIRDPLCLRKAFHCFRPDAVIHLAAQPIVRNAFADPRYTYDVNVMGTLNVLEQLRESESCQAGIFITSDKCYDNKEWIWGYRETDRLGGADIYSSSKGCAELLIHSYRHSYPADFGPGGKRLITARAGNVLGGGDWGDYRILPDCIRALRNGEKIVLRNPIAIRPWQHVLEPLSGYLLLLSGALSHDEVCTGAWNFGPDFDNVASVEKLVQKVIEAWGGGSYTCKKANGLPESELLNLDNCKARYYLGWIPVWDIDTTVRKTIAWYKNSANTDIVALCEHQIKEYCEKCDEKCAK